MITYIFYPNTFQFFFSNFIKFNSIKRGICTLAGEITRGGTIGNYLLYNIIELAFIVFLHPLVNSPATVTGNLLNYL